MAPEPFWPWLPVLIQTGPQQNGSWTLLVLTVSAHSNWSSWDATPWQGGQSLGEPQPPMLPELSIMLPELSITRLSVSSPKPFPETEKHTNNVRQNCGTHTHTHTSTHSHMCASTSPNTHYTAFTQQQQIKTNTTKMTKTCQHKQIWLWHNNSSAMYYVE